MDTIWGLELQILDFKDVSTKGVAKICRRDTNLPAVLDKNSNYDEHEADREDSMRCREL